MIESDGKLVGKWAETFTAALLSSGVAALYFCTTGL